MPPTRERQSLIGGSYQHSIATLTINPALSSYPDPLPLGGRGEKKPFARRAMRPERIGDRRREPSTEGDSPSATAVQEDRVELRTGGVWRLPCWAPSLQVWGGRRRRKGGGRRRRKGKGLREKRVHNKIHAKKRLNKPLKDLN